MVDSIRATAVYDPDIKIDSSEGHMTKGALLLFGALICLTGIGAIIGIPMIIAGIFSRSYEKGGWVGACPKCSREIYWYQATADTAQGEFLCPHCHAAITFYAGEFIHTPPAGA